MGNRGTVAAVVLAAGGSSRLGTPKQLLPLGHKPLLSHTLDSVRDASVDLRYIVLGNAASEIRASIDLNDFFTIENPDFERGQSTSVKRAIMELPETVEAVVFVLGDQPLQETTVIDSLVTAWRETGGIIVQPYYDEGPGNPVLLDRAIFAELQALEGDTGARPVIQKHRDKVVEIDVRPLRRPRDVDTPDDYAMIRTEYERKSNAGGP
jgi:molybdenum cofactor cytidylyltransferase